MIERRKDKRVKNHRDNKGRRRRNQTGRFRT